MDEWMWAVYTHVYISPAVALDLGLVLYRSQKWSVLLPTSSSALPFWPLLSMPKTPCGASVYVVFSLSLSLSPSGIAIERSGHC